MSSLFYQPSRHTLGERLHFPSPEYTPTGEWRGGISPPRSLRTGRARLRASGSHFSKSLWHRTEAPVLLMPSDFCPSITLLPVIPVDAMQQREKHDPFAPRALPRFHANTGRCAPVPGFGTLVLVGLPHGHLPSHPDDSFPASLREPEPSSRRLHAGRHVGSKQVSPTLIPGLGKEPCSDAI